MYGLYNLVHDLKGEVFIPSLRFKTFFELLKEHIQATEVIWVGLISQEDYHKRF